jgi:hypothetical protein
MSTCGSCSGTGKVHCSSCGGKRYHYRLSASGQMDMTPCFTCQATGQMRCGFCGGRGTIGFNAPTSVSPPARRRGATGTDVLAGQWYDPQGNYFDIVKKGGGYKVTTHGALGQSGSGTAELSGSTVTLEINEALIGRYALDLELEGDTMQGTVTVMGIPMPLVLTRR